LNSSVIT